MANYNRHSYRVNPGMARKSRRFPVAIVILPLLLVMGAAGAFAYFRWKPSEPVAQPEPVAEKSNTAKILLDAEVEEVLQHREDDATEFTGAAHYLAEGNERPKVRPAPLPRKPAVTLEAKPLPVAKLSAPDPQFNAPATWTGQVLVPVDAVMAKAHASEVVVRRIEAHPQQDDSLAVWVRVENVSQEPIRAEIACYFRNLGETEEQTSFFPVELAPGESFDAQFRSTVPIVKSYTVMARRRGA